MSDVVLTDVRVVTRKTHKCDWCGEVIQKGSNVRFISGRFEGEFFSSRMHDECDAACSRSDGVADEGYAPFDNQRGVAWQEE